MRSKSALPIELVSCFTGGYFLYLNISEDRVVKKSDILAILDIEHISLEISEDTDKKARSLIILQKNGVEEKVFSCISTKTLLKRAAMGKF